MFLIYSCTDRAAFVSIVLEEQTLLSIQHYYI